MSETATITRTVIVCPNHGVVPARAGSETPGAKWRDRALPSPVFACNECQSTCAELDAEAYEAGLLAGRSEWLS